MRCKTGGAMGESRKTRDQQHDDIIAAFDREQDRWHEWNRVHTEQLRDLRRRDCPVYIERRRKPRP